MLEILKSAQRGKTDIVWLKSYHSFSFGDYYNPRYMHYSFLRVINEDIVAPQSGFPMHSHQDMEIITYLISGELTHRDSLGSAESIKPGEVQLMRAGTGITHSEYNQNSQIPVHLLQIWILPREKGLAPGYQQKNFTHKIIPGELCKIISATKSADTLHIQQDVEIYMAKLNNGTIEHNIATGHKIWVQLVSGEISLNGNTLSQGDGAGVSSETLIKLSSTGNSEFLLFDFAR